MWQILGNIIPLAAVRLKVGVDFTRQVSSFSDLFLHAYINIYDIRILNQMKSQYLEKKKERKAREKQTTGLCPLAV